VVAQTFTFEVQCLQEEYDLRNSSLTPGLLAPLNPLVTNREVFRRIANHPLIVTVFLDGIRIMKRDLDLDDIRTKSLLWILKQLQVQDKILGLQWVHFWILDGYDVEGIEAFTKEWRDQYWIGKFRKVKVTVGISYHPKSGAPYIQSTALYR
jgi:hypothetical protein